MTTTYNLNEATAELGITAKPVRAWAQRIGISPRLPNGRWAFSEADLDAIRAAMSNRWEAKP